MTRRERVAAALRGRAVDRIPRTYSSLPGFDHANPGVMERIERRFPQDVAGCGFRWPDGAQQGDPCAVGTYVDEWGCAFENVHGGVIGQVKHPIIDTYAALETFKPPITLIGKGMDDVNRTCESTDGFTMSAVALQPFERMQFLRGTENVFCDLIEQPPGFFRLLEIVHEWNMRWLDHWCGSGVDAIVLADDWGTQRSLLISPELWRTIFRPLYAEYIAAAKRAGKFAYMHSDGYIIDILEDLIELGLDAINAQVTCMDMADLSRRFRGRLTFWGQMDRQHMLCFGTTDDARREVREFYEHLADSNGAHVVAQMYIEPSARPENIEAVLDAFERITAG